MAQPRNLLDPHYLRFLADIARFVRPGGVIAIAGAGLTRGAGMVRWGERVTPLRESKAELPPCDQTALEILSDAIKHTQQ